MLIHFTSTRNFFFFCKRFSTIKTDSAPKRVRGSGRLLVQSDCMTPNRSAWPDFLHRFSLSFLGVESLCDSRDKREATTKRLDFCVEYSFAPGLDEYDHSSRGRSRHYLLPTRFMLTLCMPCCVACEQRRGLNTSSSFKRVRATPAPHGTISGSCMGLLSSRTYSRNDFDHVTLGNLFLRTTEMPFSLAGTPGKGAGHAPPARRVTMTQRDSGMAND